MNLRFLSKLIFTGLVLLALFFSFPANARAEQFTPIDEQPDTDCIDINDPDCKPPTLKLVEMWVIKALYVTWAIGGITFLFGLVAIGFQWMTSGGEQQKLEELKKQATYWLISVPIFFGGVPAINFVLKLFPVNQEATCTSNLNLPAFQIIFPDSCYTGSGKLPGEKTSTGRTCCTFGTDDRCSNRRCEASDSLCSTGYSCN